MDSFTKEKLSRRTDIDFGAKFIPRILFNAMYHPWVKPVNLLRIKTATIDAMGYVVAMLHFELKHTKDQNVTESGSQEEIPPRLSDTLPGGSYYGLSQWLFRPIKKQIKIKTGQN